MLVIPAINCKNFKCVKERLEKAAEFLPKTKNKRWVQMDISDGKFTKACPQGYAKRCRRAKSWNRSRQLQELRIKNYELRNINIETHLMVNNLRANVKKWIKLANRIIFHFENFDENEFKFIKNIKRKKSAPQFGIAITPRTPVELIIPFLSEFKFVQLLAVNPGYSGQKFDKNTLNKIKFLKKYHPKIVVEIDGGINPKTARLVKKAGADIVNSGSYIFKSKNPAKVYKNLTII